MQAALKMVPHIESVDTETAASLMGITVRAVQMKVGQGILSALCAIGSGGNSGARYRIPITSLPPEAQMRWRAMQSQKAGDVDLTTYKERMAQAAVNKLALSRKAQAQERRIREEMGRAVILELQAKVDACEELKALAGKRGGVMEAKQAIADKLGVSLRQLYEYQKAYEAEGMAGLMDKTERKDKGRSRTMCLAAQDYVREAYCSAGKALQNKVTENTQRLADGLGCEFCQNCPHNPGSLARAQAISAGKGDLYPACDMAGQGMIPPANRHAVNRYIATIPLQERETGRKGWAYWEKAFMPKTLREKPDTVNAVWFGDHHEFDLFVLKDGKPVRPWLTAWLDAKSNGIVGWIISPNPNSDTVVEALARGIAKTHGSPFYGNVEMLYIDNGKDYRCKRIEGDGSRDYSIGQLNIDCNADNALLKSLGIGVTHAIPYRAWSKTIERIFGTLERRWIRPLPGWCGNGKEEKPEDLNEDIRKGRLFTFDEFVGLWTNTILPEYHNYKAEGVDQSPLEIYLSSEKARTDVPSWAMLAIAMSLRKDRKVETTGVRLNNRWYWDPALARHVGSWVTLLYGRHDVTSVTVLKDGQFICQAADKEYMAVIGEDPERIVEHMKEQQLVRRAVREALRINRERVQVMYGMAAEIPDLAFAGNITSFAHEKAYKGQKEGKERLADQKAVKTAASTAAGSKIRSKWAADGEALLQGGAKSG